MWWFCGAICVDGGGKFRVAFSFFFLGDGGVAWQRPETARSLLSFLAAALAAAAVGTVGSPGASHTAAPKLQSKRTYCDSSTSSSAPDCLYVVRS